MTGKRLALGIGLILFWAAIGLAVIVAVQGASGLTP